MIRTSRQGVFVFSVNVENIFRVARIETVTLQIISLSIFLGEIRLISLWEDISEMPSFPAQEKDMKTDVLIIGGGMAGVLCAYMLQKAGVDYVLAEAERIGSGITKYTTAKITAQHGLIYSKLIKEFGREKARQYLLSNLFAVEKYRELCADMDCDFENRDSYVYSLDNIDVIDDEIAALKELGYSAEYVRSTPLPFSVAGALKFKNQAQFSPLKFLAGISKGLNIYEHTRVRQLVGTRAETSRGNIDAKRIIVATHFPFINKHGSYYLKMFQQRSYVIALENAADVDGMYIDEAQGGLSFRNHGDLLFIGGGEHRTGKRSQGWQEIRSFADKYYPQSLEKYHWATQDCMTLDGAPYIGEYSGSTTCLYVATGFNKWGMTSSMAAAEILCDMITGKDRQVFSVFSPSRTILRPQLAVNAFEAVVNLLTPSSKRCPHLGCALKWNPYEHTWDCPCHGSRFTEDGRLINNPATGDLKK